MRQPTAIRGRPGSLPLALLIASLLTLMLGGPVRAATPRYVAPSGANTGDCSNAATPCATLAYAVLQAIAGDTIRIQAGIYAGTSVEIGKSLTIEGDYDNSFVRYTTRDPNRTVLNGGGTARPIFVNAQTNGAEPLIVRIDGLRITNGNATNAPPSINTTGRIGGGILVDGAQLYLSNVSIDNNVARASGTGTGFGGGVGVYRGATLYMQNVRIEANEASRGSSTGFGGGIGIVNGAAYLTAIQVVSNTAKPAGVGVGFGGGLYAAGEAGAGRAILDITASTISGNTAISSPTGTDGRGGGLYAGDSTDTRLTLTGNTWQSNTARGSGVSSGDGDGGAIAIVPTGSVTATISIDSDSFLANTANAANIDTPTVAQGGAIYLEADTPGAITAALTDVTIAQNIAKAGSGTASGQGGAIFAQHTILNVSGGAIRENIAAQSGADTGDGGGIRTFIAPLSLSGVTLLGNTALINGSGTNRGRGGAVAVFNGVTSSGAVTLTNTIVADNAATNGPGIREGGGIYLNNPNLSNRSTVLYATIASAVLSSDVGLFVDSGAIDVTHSIVANHATGLLSSGGDIDYNYVLFFGNTSNAAGSPPPNGGANLFSGNPAFVDAPGGNYHILSTSAARDIGPAAGVTIDIDSDPRPSGAGVDLGADEYLPPVAPTNVTISGPASGKLNQPAIFTASVTPANATEPLSYTWSPTPQGGQGTSQATYTFATTGAKIISVVVSNVAGSTSDSTTITIVNEAYTTYLPLVVR